jgi:hypothetical protein
VELAIALIIWIVAGMGRSQSLVALERLAQRQLFERSEWSRIQREAQVTRSGRRLRRLA